MSKKRYKYLAKNTALFTISSFSNKLLSFLLVPLYTSVMSTGDYGIADIISTTSTLLMHVLTLNIASAVIRFAMEEKEHPQRVLRYGLSVTAAGTGLLAVALCVIGHFHLITWNEYCFYFLLGHFIAISLDTLLSQYLRAIDKVYVMTVASIISVAARLTLNVLTLVIFKWGIIGYLVSMIAGPVLSIVYSFFHILPLDKYERDQVKDTALHKAMLSYSIPTIFSAIGWWIANSVDKYFILGLRGVSENGIYSVAYKIPSIMTALCDIFCQAWTLSAIKEYNQSDKGKFYGEVYAIYKGGLIVCCSVLILLNIPIAHLLYAKEFFSAWQYSSILIFAMLFAGLGSYLGSIFTAAKKTNILAVSTVVSALVNICLNAALIPSYGALGAAVATLASFYVVWVIRIVVSVKREKFSVTLIKDHVAYLIICVQLIAEHKNGHMYWLQTICAIVVAMMFYKELSEFVKKGAGIVINKVKH